MNNTVKLVVTILFELHKIPMKKLFYIEYEMFIDTIKGGA